jgi:hypothetical protein
LDEFHFISCFGNGAERISRNLSVNDYAEGQALPEESTLANDDRLWCLNLETGNRGVAQYGYVLLARKKN